MNGQNHLPSRQNVLILQTNSAARIDYIVDTFYLFFQ